MKPPKWTEIIQLIVRDSNHEPKESGKHKVLMDWRAKLAREPHLLQLYQIDEIVREVRRSLTDPRLHQGHGASVQRTLATSEVPA